jgi:hypothetical protein
MKGREKKIIPIDLRHLGHPADISDIIPFLFKKRRFSD